MKDISRIFKAKIYEVNKLFYEVKPSQYLKIVFILSSFWIRKTLRKLHLTEFREILYRLSYS